MWSTGLSSVQRLENGNTLILVGRFGYAFEITPLEEIVWEYINPMIAGNPISQGQTVTINQNIMFRLNRYPGDFSGFDGRDLSPIGFIELNPAIGECTIVVALDDLTSINDFQIYPNPVENRLRIEFTNAIADDIDLQVYNSLGKLVYQKISPANTSSLI